ncbi:hypothetical protein BH23GEM9_BH23GEM9_18410 [soil metagenome]
MAAGSWLAWLGLSAVCVAASLWHYGRRETPGRGRLLLALLRGSALAVLLLLLFNPVLPTRAGAGAVGGTQVLLDASLSMGMAAPDGATGWEQGVTLARSRAGGQPVLLFGESTRAVSPGELPDTVPGDARSRLLPALQAAAEAGVRRVVVVTDGRIEDADAVARWAPRLGVEIVQELVSVEAGNRALVEAIAPTWAEAGRPITVEFGVVAPGTDSLIVVARRGGSVVGRTTIAGAGAGRIASGNMELRVDPPVGGDWVPLVIALEGTDAVADDDQRTVYVHVAEEPPGIVLISLRPDWEPRFLGPVLEQALGLPLRAYIRAATGQYVRLAGGLEAGTAATEAEVQRAIGRAELLVLHGVGVDAPAWAVAALQSGRRLLVFPAAADGLPLPIAVGVEQPGDFFPASLPASPVASLLAGQELSGVAPLAGLRTADAPAGSWAPLLVTRGRGGTHLPALLGGESAGRRWVVALGSGYWQWAFRGGTDRQLYDRLWGAVAGWLVRDRALAGPEAVRPARMALPRGMPIPWVAPGLAADSLAIRLTAADGAVALDTVVAATAMDTAYTVAPPPGDYEYRARAFSDAAVTEATGRITVERFSPEFSRPIADLTALRDGPTTVREGEARRGGTPLHATAIPYVLLVLLLAAEWILRRRWGLR